MASECNPILDLEKMKEDFIVLPCKNQWDLVRTVWPDGFVRLDEEELQRAKVAGVLV